VLDFKIKQLKEEITPMQNEILSLKEKTKDMDTDARGRRATPTRYVYAYE
jgi:FtsZ-binding cell division protein ZapB